MWFCYLRKKLFCDCKIFSSYFKDLSVTTTKKGEMAEDPAAQSGEGDKKIVHTYPLVKV